MSNQNSSGKEPWLAVILSTFFPGIGQIYTGKVFRGILFIIVQTFLVCIGLWVLISPTSYTQLGLILLLMALAVPIFNLFDAHRCARKANSTSFERWRKSNKDPWLAVFLSNIILGLGHLYLGKWSLGILLILFVIVSYVIPLLGIVSLLLLPFVAYNAYTSAPVRREISNKAIKTICVFLVVIPIVFSGGIAFSIRTFVAEARYMPSGAMLPTLQINDRLIVDKWSYRFQEPKRGDIIVFYPTETLKQQNFKDAFIKRIIGLPGETVEIQNGKVYINEQPLEENYIANGQQTAVNICMPGEAYLSKSVVVPPNFYVALGDNRNNSYDSRCWGLVPRENIIGKATNLFWPLNRIGSIQ